MIHITNGSATADLLSLADVPGEFLEVADALDQGPLQPLDDVSFREARAAFWVQRGVESNHAAAVAKLTAADQAISAAAKATDDGEVVLWFEHDVFDSTCVGAHLGAHAAASSPNHVDNGVHRSPSVGA